MKAGTLSTEPQYSFFKLFFEIRSCYVTLAGLELLRTEGPPSAAKTVGTTGRLLPPQADLEKTVFL